MALRRQYSVAKTFCEGEKHFEAILVTLGPGMYAFLYFSLITLFQNNGINPPAILAYILYAYNKLYNSLA